MNQPTASALIIALVDIVDFAKNCRDKSDEAAFEILDRYYHAVAVAIAPAEGALVKCMGDGVLMSFPLSRAQEASSCLQTLSETVQAVCREFGTDCAARVHAHVGTVAAGPLGPDKHFDIVGNPVNELFMMPWDGPMFSRELMDLLAEQA